MSTNHTETRTTNILEDRIPGYDDKTQVLVVGGALTGLSAAVFLGAHGVQCVVVERHPDLLIHPRVRGINPRTVELFRQVGLETAIHAASYVRTRDYTWEAVRAETLADKEYIRIEENKEEMAVILMTLSVLRGLDGSTRTNWRSCFGSGREN